MSDNTKKNELDAASIIQRTGGRNRKLQAYIPPPAVSVEGVEIQQETPQLQIHTATAGEPARNVEPLREESKRRKAKVQNDLQDYRTLFIHEASITARSGKTVYISKEHHDRILKILHVIGKNEVSLFSYIYNALEHHFSTFQEDITELYESNIEKVF